jgi:peptide-methionine (S)-S-oxide reductase
VGYTGGQREKPTYDKLGDHTEAIQIDYDPRAVTYHQLLDVFWQSHTPSSRSGSRQYMKAIFTHTPRQAELAAASKKRLAEKTGDRIETAVLPLGVFYRAEDYHQKYMLRRRPVLWKAVTRIYPRSRDAVDSTAAARINGYLGGNGSQAQFQREAHRLGLDPEALLLLKSIVGNSARP